MVGFAQREQLPAYYALADVFVFPTHTDPWGLVVNEAMACGLPVISSDAAGCAADLVESGWNGRVFPAGDIQPTVFRYGRTWTRRRATIAHGPAQRRAYPAVFAGSLGRRHGQRRAAAKKTAA